MTVTDHVGTAVVNAALYLREQVNELEVKSMSITFDDQPLTVLYTRGQGAHVLGAGAPVALTDDDLDGERFAVVA